LTPHFLIAVRKAKAAQSSRVKYWEIIANKTIKAGFSWAGSQRSTIMGAQFGSLTRIATGNVSLRERMKS
jgi:hypothetical protein